MKGHLLEFLSSLASENSGLESRLLAAATEAQRATIVGKIISRNTSRALDLLSRYPEAAENADLTAIYASLASNDFTTACANLTQMKPGPNRQQAATGMLETLFQSDLPKAQSVMERFPEVVTDAHRHRLIEFAAADHPGLALEQAEHLSDDEEAHYETASQLKAWLKKDPDAAGKWLSEHPQPASVLNRLDPQ